MIYEKEVSIDKNLYTFILTEKSELMFYVLDTRQDKFSRFGEDKVTTTNLHGKANAFKIFKELKNFIRYLFNNNVGYFSFTCEPSRYDIYEYFVDRLIKGMNYKVTKDPARNEFYVFKYNK